MDELAKYEIGGIIVKLKYNGINNAIIILERRTDSLQKVSVIGEIGMQKMSPTLIYIFGSIINEYIDHSSFQESLFRDIIDSHFRLYDYDYKTHLTEYVDPIDISNVWDVM